ncbi:MAG TPA: cytochrome d ubiquinol oxidase subunit II, partial [Labilithrix sp.]|nr:cytochrome d ubiquinol oxidase subunit II [Labilithrix sp.]
ALTQPAHFAEFAHRWWIWPFPVFAVGCALLCPRAVAAGQEGRAFLLSAGFVGGLFAATVGTLFPVLLRSTLEPRFTLDAYNASSPRATLVIGLVVWLPAMLLAVAYFTYLYRAVRGKVRREDQHY